MCQEEVQTSRDTLSSAKVPQSRWHNSEWIKETLRGRCEWNTGALKQG